MATAEGKATSLEDGSLETRTHNKKLVADNQQLRIDLTHSQTETVASKEKISSLEQVLRVQQNRIEDLDSSKSQLEKLCEELRSASLSTEKSVTERENELREAKYVIQKLARDLHASKEKHSNLRAILSRQEHLVTQLQKESIAFSAEKSKLESRLYTVQQENRTMDEEIENLRKKLKQSSEQLTDNEHLIGYLNRQINDSSLNTKKFCHNTKDFVHRSYDFTLRK